MNTPFTLKKEIRTLLWLALKVVVILVIKIIITTPEPVLYQGF